MAQQSLLETYKSIRAPLDKIFVVPLILHSHSQTSYLYNLYRNIIEGSSSLPSIESVSVYAHLRFVIDQALGKDIILHYHWFEFQDFRSAAGMVWKSFCIQMYKLLGGKLIWTIHNKAPHRNRWLQMNYHVRKWMAHKADKIHVHCKSVVPELSDYFGVPEEKFFVHSHPRFPTIEYPRNKAIECINNHYNIDLNIRKKQFLTFGNIARYKQIEKIISLFRTFNKGNELIIAGPVKKGYSSYYKELTKQAKSCDHITIIGQFIPDEHVPWFFNGSDYVIFNHRSIIASGAVEIALSYNKDILVPSKGCISEYQDEENVHLFKTQHEFQAMMDRLLSEGDLDYG